MTKLKKSSRPEHFQLVINIPSRDNFIEVADSKLQKKNEGIEFYNSSKA